MLYRLTYAVRILLLVLYSAYALSPIYASAAACSDVRHLHGDHHQRLTVGIVWVNVLLSSLVDDPADDELDAGGQNVTEPDSDLILIKKKRAVLRQERLVPAPAVTATTTLPETSIDPGHPACHHACEVPLDLKHRESDGYSALHAGLSPPLYLS